MSDTIKELLTFFGLATPPQNISEFITYFFGAMLAIGIVIGVFNILRTWGNPTKFK